MHHGKILCDLLTLPTGDDAINSPGDKDGTDATLMSRYELPPLANCTVSECYKTCNDLRMSLYGI
jgi:hypothetical protein